MVNNFDRNKYKDTFEKRFGSGSYESGLSNARELGKTKVQAEFEKAEYDRRVKEAQKAAEKQKKEKEKKEKKDKETSAIDKLVEEKKKSNSTNKKKDSGVLNSIGNLLSDFGNAAKRSVKAANPFDDISYGEALLKNATEFDKEKSKEFDEVDRFAERTVNSASLGLKGNVDKKISGKTPDYLVSRKIGDGGGTDMLSSLLGYAVPGVGIAKGLRGTKLGANGIDDLLKNPLTKQSAKKIAGQTAKEGAAVGAIMSGAEIAGREALNPEDTNWKQNLAQFGIETGAGAILDPALTLGLGKVLSKLRKPPSGTNPAEESIQDTLAQLPTPPRGNEPHVNELALNTESNFPIRSETAATSRRQSNDLETLMNVSQGPTRTANDFSNQLDDIQSMNADLVNPDGTINTTNLRNWQNETAENQPLVRRETSATSTTTRPMDEFERLIYGDNNAPNSRATVGNAPRQEDNLSNNETVDSVADYTKGVNVEGLKDIGGFRGATSDVYRIFDDIFGKDSPVTNRVLGQLDASKSRYVDMQENLLKELNEKIVKGLGIKKGSKLSAYVQDYGEKKMDLPTLQAKAPNDWKKVVDADKWFRQKYDDLIDEINSSRAIAYPNDSSKLVPKRDDYYRHFTEFTSLTGLKNIFDTPSAIDPHLAGTSEFTRPGSRFAGFMQKRGLGPYKKDAVGGFLNYVPSASYAKEIDPNVKNVRALRSELADITEDSRNLNNFIGYLDKYANDLAGKTNPYLDRNVQDIIGRKPMAFLNWINGRVKTNTILGNLGSTLAQLANIPMGVAFAKQHSAKGVSRTMKALLDKSEPIHKSAFLRERYSDSMYRKFDERLIEQPQKMAEWIIEASDRVGSSFVWNSAYEKGLKLNVSNPIKYADNNTRKLIAGRGIGEVPLLQKSKVIQMVMPFTLEVGNQWYVMKDMIKAKDVMAVPTLLIANHVLNNVMEEVRGSSVTFDPIEATKEAIDEGLSPGRVGGRLAGEMLSNIPGGQYLAGFYPEYGEVSGFKGPTREELFGNRNPQRFGTGLVLNNGFSDPLFKLIPPFGGNQLKKTLEGMEVMQDGGSYKEGDGALKAFPFMGDTDELKFPVEMSNEDIIKMGLFGPNATDNAREYFDKERRPLSVKQTGYFKDAEARGVGQEYYDLLMGTRREESVKSKLKAIEKDETLTDEERKKSIEKVLKLLELK